MFSCSVYGIGWICHPVVKVVWFWGCSEKVRFGLWLWLAVFLDVGHLCFKPAISGLYEFSRCCNWRWRVECGGRSYVEHNKFLFQFLLALWRKFVYDPLLWELLLLLGLSFGGWEWRHYIQNPIHSFILSFSMCACGADCIGGVPIPVVKAVCDLELSFWALAMSMSSDHHPHCMPSTPEDVPGGAKTITSTVLDTSAGLVQSLKPIKNFQQVTYDASSSLILLLLS